MTGSSGPTIASTFWKKTIQGAISCDQPTRFDSCSCSRKFPAVWKNFFGTIGAREVLAHRRDIELDDPIAPHLADEAVVERHEPSHASTSSAFRSGGKTG